MAVGAKRAIYWSTNLTSWTKAAVEGTPEFPNELTLFKAKKFDSIWVAIGGTRWKDPKIYTSIIFYGSISTTFGLSSGHCIANQLTK